MRRNIIALVVLALLVTSVPFAPSCDFAGGDGSWVMDVLDPEIEVGTIALTKYPSFSKLAAYFCPYVYDVAAVESICAAALGARPPLEQMYFQFELPLTLTNDNDFAVPAVEMLTTLHVFPGQNAQELGALCIRFCDGTKEGCGPSTEACASDEPEINSVEDFVDAAADFISLWIENEVTDQVPPELAVKMIPAGGTLELRMTFTVAPEPILDILITVFEKNIDKILSGDSIKIDIPYEVNGAIWFVVEDFGRFGVNFGPADGVWSY